MEKELTRIVVLRTYFHGKKGKNKQIMKNYVTERDLSPHTQLSFLLSNVSAIFFL